MLVVTIKKCVWVGRVSEKIFGGMTPVTLSTGKKWPEMLEEWGKRKRLNEDPRLTKGLQQKSGRPWVWVQRRADPEHLGSHPVSISISPSNKSSGLTPFKIGWFDPLAVQGTFKSLLQHYNSKASIIWCSTFFRVQLSHPYMISRKIILNLFVMKWGAIKIT